MTEYPDPGRRAFALDPRLLLAAAMTVAVAGCGDEGGTNVVVDTDVATIEVTTPVDTLAALDETAQLTATARNEAGDPLGDVVFEWSSSAPSSITVESSGLATAAGAGTATLTAAAGGETGSVELHVVQIPVSVVVSPATWSPTWVGARVQLAAEARDGNDHPVPEAAFTWSSADAAVATVDTLGAATARAEGVTELRATLATDGEPAGAEPVVGAAAVTVTDEGSTAVPSGLMYTVYPARWDSFPAVLTSDRLTFPGGVYSLPPYSTRNDYCCEDLWTEANVAKFQFYGRRVGVLTDVVGGQGNFRVRDPYEEWTDLRFHDAIDFQLHGNRIALLYGPGALRIKDGAHGPWTDVASSGVVDFQMVGEHILVVREDGSVYAKDGVHGPWALLADGGVRQFLLDGPRIGLLLEDGRLRIKTGVNGVWTNLSTGGIVKFDMAGDNIVALRDDGILLGKVGVNGAWVTLATGNIEHFEVEGNRIAVVRTDGVFLAKDGMNDTWATLANGNTARIRLQGNFIAWLSDDNLLRIKEGLHAPWKPSVTVSGTVTQIEAIVRRPVPPIRITPDGYADAQSACILDTAGISCDPEINETARPAPHYGRFCGAGRPDLWEPANNYGPMDPMDALCLHHDHAAIWYPWDESIAQRCVVNHGLWNSRVTDNGALLALGSHYDTDPDRWHDAWRGEMWNLKVAVETYLGKTGGCDLAAYEATIP